jgi:hypothetical protein
MRTEGAMSSDGGTELKCADELRRLMEQDLKNLDRDVLSNTGADPRSLPSELCIAA